ncbi:MAG: ABC transporter substrate-binding protein [Halobacteriota archaeon]
MQHADPSTCRTRRSLLRASGAVGALATAGCVKRTRNILSRDRLEQLSLEIKTVPVDTDPFMMQIANHLAEHLEEIGIDARVTPMNVEELYRQVLINHDFDIYVAQFPRQSAFDPDALYSFLHPTFDSEAGWQNPFGFTDLGAKDLLEAQRTAAGEERQELVWELQTYLARTLPFVPIAFPDKLTAVRTDRFDGWAIRQTTSPLGVLALDRKDESVDTLRLTTTDPRITVNRNPIAAEFRQYGTLLDLLYDPLVRLDGSMSIPWLADSIDWQTERGLSARVTLRPNLQWHDGTALTAEDVAFTYQFLEDTSMGRADHPVPAPKYRGRTTLVEDVVVDAPNRVTFEFGTVTQQVANTALTVPLLPAHVWEEQTGPATIAGIEVNAETTDALVWNNADPIGSGPFAFDTATDNESVVFEQYTDHFLTRPEQSNLPEPYASGPAFDRVRMEVVGSDSSAIELLATDGADVTVSNLSPGVVPRIGREQAIRLLSSRSHAFYHLGFNTRRGPLANPNFRQTLARLVDKGHLVENTFDNYAVPTASPLAQTSWMDRSIVWDGEDPLNPFFADEDGQFDAAAAREAFRADGFQFNNEDEFVVRDQ